MRHIFGPDTGQYEIYEWHEKGEDDSTLEVSSAVDGAGILSQNMDDESLRSWLRAWAARNYGPNLSDDEVLRSAGFALDTRQLFLSAVPWRFQRWRKAVSKNQGKQKRDSSGQSAGLFSPGPAAPKPAPAKRSAKTGASGEVTQNMATDQQVKALEAAAESGAPFCEQCEKAKEKEKAAA